MNHHSSQHPDRTSRAGTDPVCGMTIDTGKATADGLTVEHDGGPTSSAVAAASSNSPTIRPDSWTCLPAVDVGRRRNHAAAPQNGARRRHFMPRLWSRDHSRYASGGSLSKRARP